MNARVRFRDRPANVESAGGATCRVASVGLVAVAILCLALSRLATPPLLAAEVAEKAASQSSQPAAITTDFSRQIQPILAEKCLRCHSGEEAEGGLRLNARETILQAGESGQVAVVPGQPDQGELLRRLTTSDPTERMPPPGEPEVTGAQVEKLRRWIAEGAPWNEHWAFRTLTQSALPSVRSATWVRNGIDRFVLSGLESRGWSPSPEADRVTLAKRLYYDLLGLPPSIEQVDAFLHDTSPAAYELLVDRLLANPHFGERWGRHWLDLAHYADSDGYEQDAARPDAYVYRNWVIEAINRDQPYRQFTIEQLAGDLLPGATARQRVATGFLRQTLTNEEGGVDKEEFRIYATFDRTETVGTIWLGLTVGCVRCHTHKYDPLPHDTYYRLFAFFNDADESSGVVPISATDLATLEQRLAPVEERRLARYAHLTHDADAWMAEQHGRIVATGGHSLTERRLDIASLQTLAGAAVPHDIERLEGDRQDVVITDAPEDKTTFVLVGRPTVPEITGFKLHVLADDRLPGKGPGRGPDGRLVLTHFQAELVLADGQTQPLELQWPRANDALDGFSAEALLATDATKRTGWAVDGQRRKDHWIQFRTRSAVTIPPGAMLRVVLGQEDGGQQTLSRFRLVALAGDGGGLYLPNADIAQKLRVDPVNRSADLRQQIRKYYVQQVIADEPLRQLEAEIDQLHAAHRASTMEVRQMQPASVGRTTHVFHRGDFLSRGAEVHPDVPSILPPLTPRGARADRLDLARWLVSDQQSLTPRVAVNQIWQHLFGEGLVPTPDDFGVRGAQPTQAELLDWLAKRYRDQLGWSRKELLRLILNSATYRQSSNSRITEDSQDSAIESLHRQRRFRVESEIVRDLHLSVSGLLCTNIGGKSVFPQMPADIAKLSFGSRFDWKTSQGADRVRRGLYTFFKRTIPHPNLTAFDSPDANVACVRRTMSNTPLQSLVLLNNEVHLETARALARRVMAESSPADDRGRLTWLLRTCVLRAPDEDETRELQTLLDRARNYYREHHEDAVALVGDEPTGPDMAAAEQAAWIVTARVPLNLDELLTRE